MCSRVNGNICADMVIRLSQWRGGNPEIWLLQQLQYDLWHAEQARRRGGLV